MADVFDLDRYLARIGYAGPRRADLATLRQIHALHPATIPFENLDPFLGRPVRLDLATLQAKLVGERRGGYCFEQNALLGAALEALGFSVTKLAGRVRWMAPPERPETARTHMLLRVDLDDGPYLADVGFGAHLLVGPLKLVPDIEQRTPAATLRLAPHPDGQLTLQTRLPGGWSDVYRFTMEPHFAADYEVANWYTSTYPTGLFVNNLRLERLTGEERLTLLNKRLVRRRHADGAAEERMLSGADELAETLDKVFLVTPPADAAVVWARLPKD